MAKSGELLWSIVPVVEEEFWGCCHPHRLRNSRTIRALPPPTTPKLGDSSFSRAYQVTCDYPQIAQSNPLPPKSAFCNSLPPKPGMWRSLQRDMIKAANQTGCQESKALMFTLNKDTGANQALMFTSFNVKLIEAKDETHAAASELPGFCCNQICTN